MAVSVTLSRYLGLHFLGWIAAIWGGLVALIFMVDFPSMVYQHADRDGVGVPLLLAMSLLRMPSIAQQVLPLALFFAALVSFSRLTRWSELIVARAAGVSVWQFLMPAMLIALLGGAFIVGAYNPVAARLTARFAALEAKFIRGEASLLAVANTGLWLRQTGAPSAGGGAPGSLIVHALRVDGDALRLDDVIIFRLDGAGQFQERIDAPRAHLGEGFWEIEAAVITRPAGREDIAHYRIPTNVTAAQIRESFASPETLSFWDLPRFIAMAESAGFEAVRHRLHWNAMLALPFLLVAMVLVAANFSLRTPREGGLMRLIVTGVLTAFAIVLVAEWATRFGREGALPVPLAAWVPTALAAALGANMLLHSEDG